MNIRVWLEARRPAAPADLIGAMVDARSPASTADVRTVLGQAALSDLARARARPGRVRASAFHLLAADGLLTYACEAALDENAPAEALRQVLRGIDTP